MRPAGEHGGRLLARLGVLLLLLGLSAPGYHFGTAHMEHQHEHEGSDEHSDCGHSHLCACACHSVIPASRLEVTSPLLLRVPLISSESERGRDGHLARPFRPPRG